MNLNDRINSSKALAGRVVRYHTWPTLRNQSTGEHAQRVANIYVELWGLPSAEILYHILNHDAGELYAGDTPFGAKRSVPELKGAINKAEKLGLSKQGITLAELTGEEFIKFKVADILEMFEFGLIERAMGNKLAHPIIDKTEEAIDTLTQGYPVLKLKSSIWMQKTEELFHV